MLTVTELQETEETRGKRPSKRYNGRNGSHVGFTLREKKIDLSEVKFALKSLRFLSELLNLQNLRPSIYPLDAPSVCNMGNSPWAGPHSWVIIHVCQDFLSNLKIQREL